MTSIPRTPRPKLVTVPGRTVDHQATGRAVRIYRESHGVTQEQLSLKLGFAARSWACTAEQGGKDWDEELLARVLDAIAECARENREPLSPTSAVGQ